MTTVNDVGMNELPVHHDGNAARSGDAGQHSDMARAGAAKKLAAPRVSWGMETRSRQDGLFAYGGDHLSAADADPASPLKGPPAGKRVEPVRFTPGMRSRTAAAAGHSPEMLLDIGKRILAEATSSPDDRMALAHLNVGTLPESTMNSAKPPVGKP